jgi:hypothetical protein
VGAQNYFQLEALGIVLRECFLFAGLGVSGRGANELNEVMSVSLDVTGRFSRETGSR